MYIPPTQTLVAVVVVAAVAMATVTSAYPTKVLLSDNYGKNDFY